MQPALIIIQKIISYKKEETIIVMASAENKQFFSLFDTKWLRAKEYVKIFLRPDNHKMLCASVAWLQK
jgi:hypothetical protein